MAFGGAKCPADKVERTFTVKVMSSPAQVRRAWGLLQDAGDAWAWVIDRQNRTWREGRASDNDAGVLWKEQKAHGAYPMGKRRHVPVLWRRGMFALAGSETTRDGHRHRPPPPGGQRVPGPGEVPPPQTGPGPCGQASPGGVPALAADPGR